MKKFIRESPSSIEAYQLLVQSSSLGLNILVFGEKSVGKRSLVKAVFPNTESISAVELEETLRKKQMDLSKKDTLIVYDIDMANNLNQLLQTIDSYDIKLIATASSQKEIFEESFLVRVYLAPLRERSEDTKILIEKFANEAKELFCLKSVDINDLEIDLSDNAASLKESIYRSILLNSIDKKRIMSILENFLYKEMESTNDYKELLEIFEVPLLKASKRRYKSQLKMSEKLNINRNTLRKKIALYGLD
jgi:DNA-binding NtrC family response regulator